jgi:hypothetical protein
MEYHDEVPRPFKHMQFKSNPVSHSQESDNTISFGDIADTPISICRISVTISLSQWSMREERLLINPWSLLATVQTSKMYLQVPEPVPKEGYAG